MRYVDEFRDPELAKRLLARIGPLCEAAAAHPKNR